jgi:leucyl aminopeptidase
VEFSIKSGSPDKQRVGCVVVGVFENGKLSASAESLDKAAGGGIAELCKRGDMDGKAGSVLLLQKLHGVSADRVLLVGLGKEREISEKSYRDACKAAAKSLVGSQSSEAVVFLIETGPKKSSLAWRVRQWVLALEECAYRFDDFKHKNPPTPPKLNQVVLIVDPKNEHKEVEIALQQAMAIAEGQSLTRTLGNLPGNICTPTYLAEQAQKMAETFELKCQILEEADMAELGMGSLLSVAKGSAQPPKLIALSYRGGAKKSKPVVLVGKGITFDSGGISLKPGADMDEMKFDMCGAASVLGTMQAVARMALPINLTVIVPTCENMPSGRASKPGDIVTSMSGQTIEILNTDAEGRLILCDALTYAERFDPEVVIDVATLTGACIVALGAVACGLFSNNDALAKSLLDAGTEAHDRAWHMPLWDDYQELLKSNFADMANIGGRYAGSITAACFLARFTEKYTWAHLDIAGVSHKSGGEKGATGRPVPLLTHYLINKAGLLA